MAKLTLTALLVALLASACRDGADDNAYKRASDADIPLAEGFDLKSYRGKVVLLNFWATWCGPCRIEIPALVRLRKSFRPEEVAIIGIATGERGPQRQVQQLLKTVATQFDINYELFYDHDNGLFNDWAQRASLMGSLPSTLLFNARGELQSKHLGVPRNARGALDPFGVIGEEIQSVVDGM